MKQPVKALLKLFRSYPFIACLLLIIFCFPPSRCQAVALSDSATISLLTVAPGEELYSAFGHTGIRVTDYKQKFDVVFNYGTFDDSQPGFYVDFVKGRMIYSISSDNYKDFLMEYIYEKRAVSEQVLQLNSEDKKKVFSILYENALPKNCNYEYDFFWDNCCTRPRDIFEKVLGSRLKYSTDSCGFERNKTMHDMLRLYVGNRPWVDVGFDLILGLPCEKKATPRDQTFLPDYLARLFDCATMDGQPFVIDTHAVLKYPAAKIETPFLPIYLTLLLLLVGIAVMIIEAIKKTHYYGFDFGLFLFSGLFGVFFVCLWAFTTHYSLPKNLNMLWLIPTHAVVTFFLLKRQKPVWLKYYFLATYVLMVILMLGWKWNPQPCNYAFLPLIFLFGIRAYSIFVHQRKIALPKI